MLSKFKLFEALMPIRPPKGRVLRGGILGRYFCNRVESPELPDWVKYPPDGSSSVSDSVEDFVLPKTGSFVENYKIQGCGTSVRRISSEIFNKEVDEICANLRNESNYSSPQEVVEVLDAHDIVASESLVDIVIKRFSNEWIPAFGVFRWYQLHKEYKESADLYNSMVDCLGKTKMFDLMWELVVEMVQLGGLVSLTTMTKIMRRLARGGRYIDAIVTFREMERFGLSRDIISMNVLFDALCKERGAEYAWDAFLEFKNEIPPNAHTFNVLIHGFCKARQLDKAHSTLEEMQSCGLQPCVISYTSLVEAYCREKDFRKVDALLDEMQSKGCPPNVITYTIVMHSLGKGKETYEALGVYERMKKNGCVPDTSFYNSLIYILSKAGRLQDAKNVFGEMTKSGCVPDVTTYNTMISFACEHAQIEEALRILQKMEESLCKPDLKTYAPLLKICCQKKWMKILFFLLDDMFKKDVSIEIGTYCLLVNGLCKSGNLEQACLFFEEIVLKGLVPWPNTYNRLMGELKRNNMEKEKEKIQRLMLQAEGSQQPT